MNMREETVELVLTTNIVFFYDLDLVLHVDSGRVYRRSFYDEMCEKYGSNWILKEEQIAEQLRAEEVAQSDARYQEIRARKESGELGISYFDRDWKTPAELFMQEWRNNTYWYVTDEYLKYYREGNWCPRDVSTGFTEDIGDKTYSLLSRGNLTNLMQASLWDGFLYDLGGERVPRKIAGLKIRCKRGKLQVVKDLLKNHPNVEEPSDSDDSVRYLNDREVAFTFCPPDNWLDENISLGSWERERAIFEFLGLTEYMS
jgi:hypothetical protein